MIEKVELQFDPTKSDNPKIREIFADELARDIWIGIKQGHMVDQFFNDSCLKLAKWLRMKKYQPIEDWKLTSMLRSLGMIGSQETFGTELLPYCKGEKHFSYTIKVQQKRK